MTRAPIRRHRLVVATVAAVLAAIAASPAAATPPAHANAPADSPAWEPHGVHDPSPLQGLATVEAL